MLKPSVWLAVVVLSWSVNANATTYYVDQSAGNDTANGTTPSTPWKSAPGMSSYTGSRTLSPGDLVYFDRGDTWVVSAGGDQGFYLVGGVTYIGDSWGTGTRAIIRAGSNFEAGVVRFRDHATLPTVFQGFEVDANSRVTNGVDINGGRCSALTGATKRVQNVNVHHTYSEQNSGQYNYGIIISNHGGTICYTDNVEILNSIVHDTSRDAIVLYPGDENANTRIRNILVRGNEAYNTGLDPGYCCGAGVAVKGWVKDAIIEYNYLHNVKGASLFVNSNQTNHFGTGPENIHIRYNIVTNATQNGAILVYDGSGGSDPKDLKIYGNLVYNSTVGAGLLLHNNLVGSLKVLVYNNTFYNAPVRIENSSATYPTLEFKNNIVAYSNGIPLTDSASRITAHSNNVFYRVSGTLVTSGSRNYTSSDLGSYEPSASSGNPLFKNAASLPTGFSGSFGVDLAPNTDGLSLQVGSFAVDHGATLATPYDGSVNSLTRAAAGGWDIGGYEFGASEEQPPGAPTNLRIVP